MDTYEDEKDFVRNDSITDGIRKDFSQNSEYFAINRFSVTSQAEPTPENQRRLFTSGVPKGEFKWDERDRRARMLAQQAMTVRTCLAVDLMLERLVVRLLPDIEFLDDGLLAVMNPETAESLGLLDVDGRDSKSEKVVLEKSVKIVGSPADVAYAIPIGVVFIVYSGAVQFLCREDMQAGEFAGQADQISVLENYRIQVNDGCYQCKVSKRDQQRVVVVQFEKSDRFLSLLSLGPEKQDGGEERYWQRQRPIVNANPDIAFRKGIAIFPNRANRSPVCAPVARCDQVGMTFFPETERVTCV